MSPEQQAEKTIQERLNARCETLEQYLFDCFMDAKYANAASKAAGVVFLLKKDIEALIEDTDKQVLSGVSWQRENGWLDIETAPKDGTKIQAWHILHNCPITVRYRPDVNSDCPWWTGCGTQTWPERAFTHWQPLPLPPTPASIINK